MKLIIAGSRHYSSSYNVVCLAFDYIPVLRDMYNAGEIKEVVSGGAQGIDLAGERWAKSPAHGFGSKDLTPIITRFPADWETLGKAAGPIRNKKMAEYADVLLLIWDGQSPGSKNMKMNMEKLGKPIYEVVFSGPKKA